MKGETTLVRTSLTGTVGALRGEVRRWVGWRGLFHLVLWLVVIEGFVYISIAGKQAGGLGFEQLMNGLTFIPAVAGIVLTAAAVCGNYHDGTAAWVLGKPVPRYGYVLSVLGGVWAGLTITVIVVPGMVAYWWLPRVEPYRFVTPEAPPLATFLFALVVLSVVLLFFISITAFVSVLTRRRSIAAVVSLWALLMLGVPIIYPDWYDVLPARIIRLDLSPGNWSELTEYIHGNTFEAMPAVWGTLGLTAIFMAAGIAIFRRLDL